MNTNDYILAKTPQPPTPRHPLLPQLAYRPSEIQLGEHEKHLRKYQSDLALYKDQKEIWDAYWKDRQEETGRLTEKFWEDARAELGYGNHPKKDRLEGFAWQNGHSGGLSEVWLWLQEGWELLKD